MKRRWIGLVLIGLGAFLLVVGVLTTVWAPGAVKKTPLDVDQTTFLDGTIRKLNFETQELEENPVKVRSVSQTDTNASTDDVVVWTQSTCVVLDIDDAPECVDDSDPRLVTATTDVFASDRVTAEAIPDFENLPADAVPHEGLVNKWPFDSEKKDYTYWNGTLDKAIPAVYQGTEDVAGIETYVYKMTVEDAEIEIADGVPGTYDDVTTIYVEPKTGAIQQQTDSMQQYLEDGTQVVDLNIGFTDDQIEAFADDAETNMQMLSMMTMWAPIAGFVGGVLAVVAGLALLLSASRRDSAGNEKNKKQLAGASS